MLLQSRSFTAVYTSSIPFLSQLYFCLLKRLLRKTLLITKLQDDNSDMPVTTKKQSTYGTIRDTAIKFLHPKDLFKNMT
jgi:hypothetical protein